MFCGSWFYIIKFFNVYNLVVRHLLCFLHFCQLTFLCSYLFVAFCCFRLFQVKFLCKSKQKHGNGKWKKIKFENGWCINMNDGKSELNNLSVLCVSEDLLKVQYPHFFTQAPPNIYLWLYNYLCKQQCAAFPCIPSVTLRLERVIMVKCAFLTQLIIILMHSFITLLIHSPNGDVMWQS